MRFHFQPLNYLLHNFAFVLFQGREDTWMPKDVVLRNIRIANVEELEGHSLASSVARLIVGNEVQRLVFVERDVVVDVAAQPPALNALAYELRFRVLS